MCSVAHLIKDSMFIWWNYSSPNGWSNLFLVTEMEAMKVRHPWASTVAPNCLPESCLTVTSCGYSLGVIPCSLALGSRLPGIAHSRVSAKNNVLSRAQARFL